MKHIKILSESKRMKHRIMMCKSGDESEKMGRCGVRYWYSFLRLARQDQHHMIKLGQHSIWVLSCAAKISRDNFLSPTFTAS